MGESKTPEYPEACWLLLERKLQLCPTCIAIYGKWKHHPLYESNPSGYRSPNRFRPGITTGMAYLHSYDPPICHGDLKPANVLISDEPTAILCDFGLATFIQDSGVSSGLTTSRTIKGSTRYMSPEFFNDAEAQHTLESDIWAWACTIFEVITDTVPYAAFPSEGSVILALVQGTPPGSMELFGSRVAKLDRPLSLTSAALNNLISECWNMVPGERPSFSSLLERLNFVGLENPDPAPTQPLDEEEETDYLVVNESTAPSPSILSKDQDEKRGYYQTKIPRFTKGAPDPEVVLRLDAPHGECFMRVAPNGEWLVTSFHDSNDRRAYLWNLRYAPTLTVGFPAFQAWQDDQQFEWSPDSRYLACFGKQGLYIWSTQSQSVKMFHSGQDFESAAWFSSGQDLVLWSGQQVSILDFYSGGFQAWASPGVTASWRTMKLATVPMNRFKGRRKIVIMVNGRQIQDSYSRFLDTLIKSTKPQSTAAAGYTMIVYDLIAHKCLAFVPQDHYVWNIKVDRNGEFALMSHGADPPTLWRLVIPASGEGPWDIQKTLTYSSRTGPYDDQRFVRQAHFGGANDEWVISATTKMDVMIWETQSSEPFQVANVVTKSGTGENCRTIYCPATKQSGPRLLCYGFNNQELVIWKWWN